jgi:hypothetical protein
MVPRRLASNNRTADMDNTGDDLNRIRCHGVWKVYKKLMSFYCTSSVLRNSYVFTASARSENRAIGIGSALRPVINTVRREQVILASCLVPPPNPPFFFYDGRRNRLVLMAHLPPFPASDIHRSGAP